MSIFLILNENFLQLCAVIIFGCISTKGWYTRGNQEECIFNKDSSACNYGVGISVIAFLASMGFLAGEYFFEQMSSVKTRKHYVLADLGFSGENMNVLSLQVALINNMDVLQVFGHFCMSSHFCTLHVNGIAQMLYIRQADFKLNYPLLVP